MKVRELVAALQAENPDAVVMRHCEAAYEEVAGVIDGPKPAFYTDKHAGIYIHDGLPDNSILIY